MRTLWVFLIVCLVGLGGSLASANLLTNGNLDRTHAVEIVPGFFLPQPDSWVNNAYRTLTGPYWDDLSSEPWAGPAPTPVTTDGNLNGPPPNGFGGPDGAIFFKAFSGNSVTGDLATGHVYQDNLATPGLRYTLTGWAGAEANYKASKSLFALDFLNAADGVIGSAELDLVAAGLQVPNGEPFSYKQYTVVGTAPAGTAKVRARISMIDGFANPAGGGQAFVVDDFDLTVVPEPSSLAFLALASLASVRLWRRT